MKNRFSKQLSDEHKLAEVISVASHQLKTPLSAIKGYLDVLLSEDLGKLTSGQKDYLKDALENTNQMINLVKDFLDITKIEANRMEFKPKPTNLAKIVKETVKEFSSLARARNCKLSFDILDKLPLVETDPIKIKQVIANIISNAILYNKKKGKVEISLSKKGKEAIFCCKDTGIGITEKDKIFTKFYRSERVLTRASSGSGLGLFISQAIIEKGRGKIWFESEENKGTTFCFSLPIKKV